MTQVWAQTAMWLGLALVATILTFLAGAELDPQVFRRKWREASAIGLAGFLLPFLGCAAGAHWLLGWESRPSWLAGVAMSTTSVAVVYGVMLEFGLNRTDYGKTLLAACFINDLVTVLALGFIFAPFSERTACTATGRRSWRPSSCCSVCSDWGRSRAGPTARLCCLLTSSAWCWQAPWARITC